MVNVSLLILFTEVFLITLLVASFYQTGMYIFSRVLKRTDIVDVGWGMGFVIVSFFWLMVNPVISVSYGIILLCVSLWGTRLSFHIAQRFFSHKKEDRRYVDMRKEWKWVKTRTYFQVFLLQGVLLSVILFPVYLHSIAHINTFLPLVLGGFILWSIGFYYQVVGDFQLTQFIKNKTPESKDQMMKTGVWSQTRHPNYFGEILMWWGIWIMTLVSFNPVFIIVTAMGPLTITLLLRYVSGVPMLEKHWKEKYGTEFEEYKDTTQMLLPSVFGFMKKK